MYPGDSRVIRESWHVCGGYLLTLHVFEYSIITLSQLLSATRIKHSEKSFFFTAFTFVLTYILYARINFPSDTVSMIPFCIQRGL